ncbi:MAG: DUF2911 domain-containing protein [Gemmatimonadaceae bacterium]
MRYTLPSRSIVVALAMVAAAFPGARAQIRASERATVSQTVDGTVVTVDYSRPQLRGRDSLWGKVVPHEEIWTPGANLSTSLQVSRDVKIAGQPLPAGKYSLWMVTKPGEWKLHVHRNATLFHTRPPRLDDMLLSIPVTPVSGEKVEVLTFDFPRVWPEGTELRFRWGTTVVPIEILVQPTYPSVAMSAEQIAPYLGSYSVTFQDGGDHRSPPQRLTILNAKGTLRAILDTKEPVEIQLIPTATPNQFMTGFLDKGKLFDVETMPLQFEMAGGRAVGFQVGALGGGPPWMLAKRTN